MNLRDDGKSKIFDNSKGSDPIHIAYEEEVDLENSVTTSLKNAFTFDTTVGTETTVSGEYAGVSLEEKITAEVHTGFSKEEGKDTEESKTESETVAIEFDCHPGGIKLLGGQQGTQAGTDSAGGPVYPGLLDSARALSLVAEGTGNQVEAQEDQNLQGF